MRCNSFDIILTCMTHPPPPPPYAELPKRRWPISHRLCQLHVTAWPGLLSTKPDSGDVRLGTHTGLLLMPGLHDPAMPDSPCCTLGSNAVTGSRLQGNIKIWDTRYDNVDILIPHPSSSCHCSSRFALASHGTAVRGCCAVRSVHDRVAARDRSSRPPTPGEQASCSLRPRLPSGTHRGVNATECSKEHMHDPPYSHLRVSRQRAVAGGQLERTGVGGLGGGRLTHDSPCMTQPSQPRLPSVRGGRRQTPTPTWMSVLIVMRKRSAV